MSKINDKTIKLLLNESFQKWIAGRASKDEIQFWESWMEKDSKNRSLHSEALKIWQKSQFRSYPLPDVKSELDSLGKDLNLHFSQTFKENTSISRVSKNEKNYYSWKRIARYSGAIASVIIFFILVIWFLLSENLRQTSNDYAFVSTQSGERVTLRILPECKIVVNANSTLYYPIKIPDMSKISVKLEGEAFFEISKKEESGLIKFEVETQDGFIEVRGTRFSVYERGISTRVAVEEGQVEIKVKADEKSSSEFASKSIIIPGQMVNFCRGDMDLKPVYTDLESYTSWWQDFYRFKHTPVEEIVDRLEETYGVTITVLNHKLLSKKITGSVENGDLDVILDALSLVLQTAYRKEKNHIIFQKSFSIN